MKYENENMVLVSELYGSMRPQEIADKLGLKLGTVYGYACQMGVTEPGFMSYEEKIKILAMRINGVAFDAISEATGYSSNTVHKLCKRVGLPGFINPWPMEKLLAEIEKYDSYRDFRLKSPAAYQYARKHGLLGVAKSKFGMVWRR